MASLQESLVIVGTSPRSTILIDSERMKASGKDDSMASGLANGGKASTPSNETSSSQTETVKQIVQKSERGETVDTTKSASPGENLSEEQSSKPIASSNINPRPASSAYYLGYSQQNVAPPSPLVSGVSTIPYDAVPISSFVPQPITFIAAHTTPFGMPNSNTPLSPPRTTPTTMAGIPPASPLFPRVTNNGVDSGLQAGHAGLSGVAPPSPSLPYISPALGSSGTYQTSYATSSRLGNQATADEGAWERANTYLSPQLSAQGMIYGIMPRTAAARAYSFEGESMLPPSVLDPQDQANPAYSPYSASHSSPASGALFTHQQPWSYPSPPPDMYATPGSPLQPRPAPHAQMNMYATTGAMSAGIQPLSGPYGHPQQFYPASSPGPPIQTTASNKGPDGANLFIFHIPNHFTNVDMYNLFCRYGNLLSVRIMVEKDTGRSRGFGFVSYDHPEAAAHAIKELNGYTIGNKRLKVQHKQIRSRDLQDRDGSPSGTYGLAGTSDGGFARTSSGFTSSLPPSGPMSNPQNLWYDPRATAGVKTPTTAVAAAVANVADGVGKSGSGSNSSIVEDETAELTPSTSEGNNDSRTGGVVTSTSQTSPLSNMGALQSALPDVTGTTVE